MNPVEFERIMERALDSAQNVQCSLEEYYEGLLAMRAMLDDRIDCVRSELP